MGGGAGPRYLPAAVPWLVGVIFGAPPSLRLPTPLPLPAFPPLRIVSIYCGNCQTTQTQRDDRKQRPQHPLTPHLRFSLGGSGRGLRFRISSRCP